MIEITVKGIVKAFEKDTNLLDGISFEINSAGRKKLVLAACVVLLLGNLMVFKYLGFLVENVNGLLGLHINIGAITLPIGISFYTFQILSYVIDLYRGYVAKRMEVGAVIAAAPARNVRRGLQSERGQLTGLQTTARPFYNTTSPSMDILISSNLERLLYLLSGSDETVRGYMQQLAETGHYKVDAQLRSAVQEIFAAGCCDDARTAQTIAQVYNKTAARP